MRGLPARVFGPTVKSVCWNIVFFLRAIPATIYKKESLCVRG